MNPANKAELDFGFSSHCDKWNSLLLAEENFEVDGVKADTKGVLQTWAKKRLTARGVVFMVAT